MSPGPPKAFIQLSETLRIIAKLLRILQYTKDVGAEMGMRVESLGCSAELLSQTQLLLFTLYISWAKESLYSPRSVGPQGLKKTWYF